MNTWRRRSTIEQFRDFLREELWGGRWSGVMPGVHRLAAEFGINRKTVEAALQLLEKEGLLVGQGAGRCRRIELPREPTSVCLRVALLNYAPLAQTEGYILELQHLLQEAGHDAIFTGKSLLELGMNVGRVARLVGRSRADAWIVGAGSLEVLKWFVGKGIPVFARFGRRRGLPLAGVGPDKVVAYRTMVRRLVALGHRRIVQLTPAARRLPKPGKAELAFHEELTAQGIAAGPYNLPDWEESPEGLRRMLDRLFRVTPPTALLVDEAYRFHAVKHHLAVRGIMAPRDVSLVCTDPDRSFDWCRPSIAHVAWDPRPVVRRIVRWANNVAQGKDDRRQSFTKAEFVEGGTIGPV